MAADYGLDNPDSLFDGPNRDSLVFKGVNYRNANEMHRAVVADWLSAGGELCHADVKDLLDKSSEDLAETLERDWGLAQFPWFNTVASLSGLLGKNEPRVSLRRRRRYLKLSQ